MIVDVCPACGYPTLGPDLCSVCRPLVAKTLTPSSNPLAEQGLFASATMRSSRFWSRQ